MVSVYDWLGFAEETMINALYAFQGLRLIGSGGQRMAKYAVNEAAVARCRG